MKMIALDLGSHMALAHNGFGDVVLTDHRHFEGTRVQRAGAILTWLEKRVFEIMQQCPDIDAIIYERPFARGFDATRSGWGLAGIVEATAERNNLACLDLTPQDIKKFALGKRPRKKMTSAERRRAHDEEKILMIDAACSMGYVGADEHEADAYCLLKCALSTATKEPAKCHTPASQTQNSLTASASKKKSAPVKRRRSTASPKVLSAKVSAKRVSAVSPRPQKSKTRSH